jgi:hypothetical protein
MDIFTVPVPMVYSYKKPLLSLTITANLLDKSRCRTDTDEMKQDFGVNFSMD